MPQASQPVTVTMMMMLMMMMMMMMGLLYSVPLAVDRKIGSMLIALRLAGLTGEVMISRYSTVAADRCCRQLGGGSAAGDTNELKQGNFNLNHRPRNLGYAPWRRFLAGG